MSLYNRKKDIGENTALSAGLGGLTGMFIGGGAATVGTFWSGYELGTVINDVLTIDPTVARGAIDILVMATVAGPLYSFRIIGGGLAGVTTGGALSAIGSEIYNKFKRSFFLF